MKRYAVIYRTNKWVQTNDALVVYDEVKKGRVAEVVDRHNNYLVKKGAVTLYGRRTFNAIGVVL